MNIYYLHDRTRKNYNTRSYIDSLTCLSLRYTLQRSMLERQVLMPLTFAPLENGRILRYGLSDPLTLQDIFDQMSLDRTARANAIPPTHTLIVAHQLENPPPGIVQLLDASTLIEAADGHIAVVTTSLVIRSYAEMLAKLAKLDRLRFFDTEAEALDFLRSRL